MRFRPDLVKGTTPAVILALLAERPMHGYELARAIDERSAGLLRFGQGTLYPVLHRLERDGLIAGRWEAAPGGPDRRVYRLTPDGHGVLAERRAEWQSFVDVIGRFLSPVPTGKRQGISIPVDG